MDLMDLGLNLKWAFSVHSFAGLRLNGPTVMQQMWHVRKMRAGVALSLLSSSTFQIGNLTQFPTIYKPNILQLSSFSRSITPSFNLPKKPFQTVSAAMSSSFMPEQARVPPAVELPAPPVTKFKIALCQLSVTEDKERNIAHARKAIEEAAEKGVDLVLLPEIWNSPYSNDSFPVYAEDIDSGGDASPSTAMLSEVAHRLQITIVGGSIPERSEGRLYNTCCVFGKDGKLRAKHRKLHLFDIDIPGQITFKESKTLTAGENPTIVDTGLEGDTFPHLYLKFTTQDVGRIGIGICYDIRFEELAMLYAARGAHLLCYPGAFNMTTGPLHWELLQRARATDNQLFVATCSPARDPRGGYVAWGHSTLVGPFGQVLATTEHEETTIIAEIDYSQIDLRRTNLPLGKQKRGDLYQLVDIHRLKSQST